MAARLPIPGFRPYRVTVERRQVLSPHFVRVDFQGPELARLGTDGFDQRIKIILPLPDGRWGDPQLFDPDSVAHGMWYQQWKALDNADRNPVRTYTIRRADPLNCRLTVDFVVHDDPGPAGRFAAECHAGDEAVIIGPDGLSVDSGIGIDFQPGQSRHVLLVGDETAVPAIAAIVEHLSEAQWEGTGIALTEVRDSADYLALEAPKSFEVSWAARGDAERGSTIVERLRRLAAAGALSSAPDHARIPEALETSDPEAPPVWEVPPQAPDDGLYAWVAGESSMVRGIRRFLIGECGLDRHRIAFMGYWRQGKKEI